VETLHGIMVTADIIYV